MAQMAGSKLVGIKQSVAVMSAESNTIVFNVDSKPWGLLITCNNDTIVAGKTLVKRISAIWTDYGGGQYVGGRVAVNRGTIPDHYNVAASGFIYDENAGTISIYTPSGAFENGVTYYLWYFTIPF